MEELSELRKKVSVAETKRLSLLSKVLKTKPFIAAQVYEHYKKCGHESCKCARGELHGPFIWLYQHKKGQPIISTTVDSEKKQKAKDLAANYTVWLRQRQTLRELDQEIQTLLNAIEAILEQEAKDYVTKRHPGRPKKSG